MKPSALRCRNARNLLPLHVGGDLDARLARALDEHLHSCLVCFREFRELALMRERLGVLAEEPLPAGVLDGFTEEVMARVAVGEEGPAAPAPGLRRRWRPAARMAAAAALLLALTVALDGLGGQLMRDPGGQGPAGLADGSADQTDGSGSRLTRPRILTGPPPGTLVDTGRRPRVGTPVYGPAPEQEQQAEQPADLEPEPGRKPRLRQPIYGPR